MYLIIDCACIGVTFDSTLVRLIILLTLDGKGLNIVNNSNYVIHSCDEVIKCIISSQLIIKLN